MREALFVPKADDLALATSHLVQSSSASRFAAGAFGFFILNQSGERPDASEQGVYQHPEQRSEANQSAEYGDN